MVILGEPYAFSVIVSVIKTWNTDKTFNNGILLFCIDGTVFPGEVVTATLSAEVPRLKEKMLSIAMDEPLFSMPKEEAWKKIYELSYPEDICIGNDYRFDWTPLSLSDNDCFIFAVGCGDGVRILAAKAHYCVETSRHVAENSSICETFVSREYLRSVAAGLDI